MEASDQTNYNDHIVILAKNVLIIAPTSSLK